MTCSRPSKRPGTADGDTRGAIVLDHLLQNADIARRAACPYARTQARYGVCLEVGPDVAAPGDVFADVDEAVARAYTEARLRKSVVRDALFDHANTGDNTPAFTDIHFVDALELACSVC